MPNSVIRNFDKFDIIHLYFSCNSKQSSQYEEIYKRSGVKPRIVFPDYWYGKDTDREEYGYGGTYFGRMEFKYVRDWENINLASSDFQIESDTVNFTIRGIKGVRHPKINVIPMCKDYSSFCNLRSRLLRTETSKELLGKGWFIVLLYDGNLDKFALLNCSGSELIFDAENYYGYGKKGYLQRLLVDVSKLLTPVFDEFTLFLTRCYLRCDYYALYNHLTNKEFCELEDDEEIFLDKYVNELNNTRDKMICWDAYSEGMEWLLNAIHIDTIYEKKTYPKSKEEILRNIKRKTADRLKTIQRNDRKLEVVRV